MADQTDLAVESWIALHEAIIGRWSVQYPLDHSQPDLQVVNPIELIQHDARDMVLVSRRIVQQYVQGEICDEVANGWHSFDSDILLAGQWVYDNTKIDRRTSRLG